MCMRVGGTRKPATEFFGVFWGGVFLLWETSPNLTHAIDVQRVPERRRGAPLVWRRRWCRGGTWVRVRVVAPASAPAIVGRTWRRWGNGLRADHREAVPGGVGDGAPVVERIQLIPVAVPGERVTVWPGCARRKDLGGAGGACGLAAVAVELCLKPQICHNIGLQCTNQHPISMVTRQRKPLHGGRRCMGDERARDGQT